MVGQEIAAWVVGGLAMYGAVGVLFALFFVVAGVNRIDPTARESTWGFRVMIFPGAVALWPLLLKRSIRRETAPAETNAHRSAARSAP